MGVLIRNKNKIDRLNNALNGTQAPREENYDDYGDDLDGVLDVGYRETAR
jgi:hypothetical protein